MTLEEFFHNHHRVAIAFSGGVDSSFLLYAGMNYGADIKAYYVKSAFQPAFELEDAGHLALQLGVPMEILKLDVLQDEKICCNSPDRCYYCKKKILGLVMKAAREDHFSLVVDGTNFSDQDSERPGMKALGELKISSPLRECRMTKDEIRRRSREAGLFTWDKPAYACLATRIRQGEEITQEKLRITEISENILFQKGFRDFRIRLEGRMARICLQEEQMDQLFLHRKEILEQLQAYYDRVVLDLTPGTAEHKAYESGGIKCGIPLKN